MAIHRLDPDYAFGTGLVHEIRMENGVLVNVKGTISEELQDDVHLFIQLQGKWPKNVEKFRRLACLTKIDRRKEEVNSAWSAFMYCI